MQVTNITINNNEKSININIAMNNPMLTGNYTMNATFVINNYIYATTTNDIVNIFNNTLTNMKSVEISNLPT
mgnify:CR=1 FL=1|jgi:hypothetical protein